MLAGNKDEIYILRLPKSLCNVFFHVRHFICNLMHAEEPVHGRIEPKFFTVWGTDHCTNLAKLVW